MYTGIRQVIEHFDKLSVTEPTALKKTYHLPTYDLLTYD